MTMTIKIGGVAGLTGLASPLARGNADPLATGVAVAGLTTKTTMGLAYCGIWSQGGRGMATDTQGHRGHRMGVTMTIKVGTMTGLTVGSGRLTNGAADQLTGRAMAGLTSKSTVGLTGCHKGCCRGRCMTVRAHGHRTHAVAMAMAAE